MTRDPVDRQGGERANMVRESPDRTLENATKLLSVVRFTAAEEP
jgi:hypothetical protein